MMKKMKRLITLLCCLAIVFALTGCDSTGDTETATPDETGTTGMDTEAPDGSTDDTEEADDPYAGAREFYAGQDVTLYVPQSPGGGMDNAARIAAPFLQELLGARTVTVENMTGGGVLVCYNYLYNSGDREGLDICFGTNPGAYEYIQEDEAVAYDSLEFNYIATVQHTVFALTVKHDGPFSDGGSIRDADTFVMGGFAYNDTMSLFAAVTLEALGIEDSLLIGGYGGSANCLLAMEQDEIDAYCCPLDSLDRYVSNEQCDVVALYAHERDPYWPDVPTMYELFDISPELEQMFNLLPESDRIIFMPPEVPEDRLDFVEYCVMQMIEDPEFIQQMTDSTGYFSGSLSGAETLAVVQSFADHTALYREMIDILDKYIR